MDVMLQAPPGKLVECGHCNASTSSTLEVLDVDINAAPSQPACRQLPITEKNAPLRVWLETRLSDLNRHVHTQLKPSRVSLNSDIGRKQFKETVEALSKVLWFV